MNLSVYLAQLFGLLYTVIGVGMLLNAKAYKRLLDDMEKNTTLLFLGGTSSLAVGFTIATFHNIWVTDWRVIITIFGWMALVKGFLLLTAPDVMLKFTRIKNSQMPAIGIFVIAMGLVLSYFGFVA
jgi:hypothetical protein